MAQQLNVLVLCTGNSARSIMAEALFNHMGGGRIEAYSAGSHPKGAVDPRALSELTRRGLAVDGLTSKSWDVFATPDAPRMDLVVTVCDRAAVEACPVWQGTPVRVHWNITDPAAVGGDERAQQAAFARTFESIEGRIAAFCRLRVEALGGEALRRAAEALRSD